LEAEEAKAQLKVGKESTVRTARGSRGLTRLTGLTGTRHKGPGDPGWQRNLSQVVALSGAEQQLAELESEQALGCPCYCT
jgi:hypothetical protein